MTVVGVDRPNNRKNDEAQNCSNIRLEGEQNQSVKLITDETKRFSKNRDVPVNVYLKYVLPCDLLRLALSIFLLCTLVIFIKQSKYVVIHFEQLEPVSDNIDKSLENTKYTLVDDTSDFEYKEQYKYDILLIDDTLNKSKAPKCANVPEIMRIDCHPEDGASEMSCNNRGCCWKPLNNKHPNAKRVPLNVPYCYYPDNWQLYEVENVTNSEHRISAFLKQSRKSFYKNDIPMVKLEITDVQDSIIRAKIFDPVNIRHEPQWPIRPDARPFSKESKDSAYKVDFDEEKVGFKVSRPDGTLLYDALTAGGFIFSDQFLQISIVLSTHNIYGIGERQGNLKLNTSWQSFTLFNKDQVPIENANLYGTHPFFMAMDDSGRASGLLFLNSNAMDIILQPFPAITFRTIGGIFDIYIFFGPTPADVIRQYSEVVGKPFLPPYWSLGFHLCRFGYGSLENTKKVWNRTIAAGIPFDTQWNDLDYMDKNNDFTYNKKKFKDLPKFVDDLHAVGMHYIPLIDAGISGPGNNGSYLPYEEGVKRDIFIKDTATNKPFIGKVWNLVSTVWPDFTHPKSSDYFYDMMNNMHKSFAFDGAWIDMNEPSNFYDGLKNGCTHNNLDYPQYVPNVVGGLLSTKTVCMNAKQYSGPHYNLHNMYGISQAIATNYALTKIRRKRPFIISRSTWVGQGHYSGHWSGDVYSSWHDMRRSIPEMLSMNFFQIPMVGADICGFNGNTTVALCNRWMQLGAFYPFSRNHNSDEPIEQDPVAMGDLVVRSSKRALKIRYQLLPYLYTLFFRAHKFGDTVARPLFFEFLDDRSTYDIDTQFLWGRSLMIIPVLEEHKTNVRAYLPRGLWYNFYTKKSMFTIGKYYTLNAPLDTIPLMIRGGSVLPTQKPAATTTESRKNPFELLITLDHLMKAEGELYWDDGDSLDSYESRQFLWIKFIVKNQALSAFQLEKGSFREYVMLGKIQIFGVTSEVKHVILNNNEIGFKYDKKTLSLTIDGLAVDLRKKFSVGWTYGD